MTDILQPAIFDELPVTAAFTTRNGGVSDTPYDTFNFGYQTGDSRDSVERNHRILYDMIEADSGQAAFMNQVHGAAVTVVDSAGISMGTDGIVTTVQGLLLCVKCADCIPLLMSDTNGSVIAAVHCGWRPLVAGIAERALAAMLDTGVPDPSGIVAAIGPAAAACCYEIGAEVADRLDTASVVKKDGHLYGDLTRELKHRLATVGVPLENISDIGHCTICNPGLYYSHRRDGAESGRMLGCIMRV